MEATVNTLGMAIAVAGALGIFTVGALYLLVPRRMASSFGLPHIPPAEATAWLHLKGIRDLATGIVAAVLIAIASPVMVGTVVLVFAIVPVGDALTVMRARGSTAAALGIHGSTAAVMVLGGLLLVLP